MLIILFAYIVGLILTTAVYLICYLSNDDEDKKLIASLPQPLIMVPLFLIWPILLFTSLMNKAFKLLTPTKYEIYDGDYDLEKYKKSTPNERLMILQEAWKTASPITKTVYEGQMLGITVDLEEHPEGFNHGCLCELCCSYA